MIGLIFLGYFVRNSAQDLEISSLSPRQMTKRILDAKKFENHAHMVALYAVWYSRVRIHKMLRVAPAMAAGLTSKFIDWSDNVGLMDAAEVAPKRGPYKKTVGEISN